MQKWVIAACAGVGVSLSAWITYNLYYDHPRCRHRKNKLPDCSGIDIEEILDDDILEEYEGAREDPVVNSDDEIDSDLEISGIENRVRSQKRVGPKEGAQLRSLARKIRANRDKLAENDGKKLLKGWMSNKENEYGGTGPQPKIGKDAVFYNLFACYAETACKPNKV